MPDMAEGTKGGRVALITGSTAGIGRAVALSMAREGCRVILNGRREESRVIELKARIDELCGAPGSCDYVRGDVADEDTRDRITRFIGERYGRLDVLVNNAGMTTEGRKDMLSLTEDNIVRVLKVNLVAPFLLTAACARFLNDNERTCYVVNISSISADTVSTNRADYCVSKAGMSMMTKLFAVRLARHNVRVFEVRPGIVHTGMTDPVREKYDGLIAGGLLPVARWGEPEDVARAVTALVAGNFDYTTGEVICVDGGFHLRSL